MRERCEVFSIHLSKTKIKEGRIVTQLRTPKTTPFAMTMPRSIPSVKLMKQSAIKPATVVTELPKTEEKVLEMEGAQNVEVLTDLTGDELEILDPYGAELVTYGICYETLSNTIHKLAELLNEENMEV